MPTIRAWQVLLYVHLQRGIVGKVLIAGPTDMPIGVDNHVHPHYFFAGIGLRKLESQSGSANLAALCALVLLRAVCSRDVFLASALATILSC